MKYPLSKSAPRPQGFQRWHTSPQAVPHVSGKISHVIAGFAVIAVFAISFFGTLQYPKTALASAISGWSAMIQK